MKTVQILYHCLESLVTHIHLCGTDSVLAMNDCELLGRWYLIKSKQQCILITATGHRLRSIWFLLLKLSRLGHMGCEFSCPTNRIHICPRKGLIVEAVDSKMCRGRENKYIGDDRKRHSGRFNKMGGINNKTNHRHTYRIIAFDRKR